MKKDQLIKNLEQIFVDIRQEILIPEPDQRKKIKLKHKPKDRKRKI